MPQTADKVLNDLKNRHYAPVYFLQGEEPYYIDLISNYIEKNILSETEKGFNQIIMYGKDCDVNAIITNARRFPMMSERQVVIVKEAQEILDLNKEAGQKVLLSYLKNPLTSTLLVLCYKYKKLDSRKTLAKELEKEAVVVASKKLYDNQIPDWITNYLKNKGHQITTKATYMITEFIGNNLERISNEIDKLLINFDEKAEINEQHVEKYVGISKEFNAFELQKAIIQHDNLKAQKIANYFASNPKNNPIIPIVALLFAFFSKVLLVHSTNDKSDKNIASVLKVNPFFVRDYKTAISNYSMAKVINNIHHLKMADLQAKGIDSGTVAEGDILKELLFKLLH